MRTIAASREKPALSQFEPNQVEKLCGCDGE